MDGAIARISPGAARGGRVPRIDRYILSQLIAFFGFFALVLVSIYWLNRAVLLFEELIADGQTALVVLEFTALTLPVVIALVLPVAAFAAAAYATNRFASESELVAMQAAGLSPWRLARPVAVFGVMVGLMVALLVHGLVPMARTRLADRQAQVAEDVAARFLRAGSFQFPTAGVALFIRDIADDGTLHDLLLSDSREAGRETLYTAEEALIVRSDTGPKLIMVRGLAQTTQHEPGGEPRLSVTRFADLSYDIGGMIGGKSNAGRNLRDYSTPRLLRAAPDLLEATGATAVQARFQAHLRLAQPFMSPVAALLGFAMLLLGGFSRFGVGRQVLAAILALIALQFVATAAEQRASVDPAGSWPLVYLPPVIGAAGALCILWLAGRPRRRRGRVAAAVTP